jgi:hypothetical protein
MIQYHTSQHQIYNLSHTPLLLHTESLDEAEGCTSCQTTNDHRADRAVEVSSSATRSATSSAISTSHNSQDERGTHVKYVLKPPKMNRTTPVTMQLTIRPVSALEVIM